MDDWGLPGTVLGLLVVGVVAYVGMRAMEARRRGDDPAKAAAQALRDVGPPALAAAAGLVLAVVIAGFAGLLFLILLIGVLFNRSDGDALVGVMVLLGLSGVVFFGSLGGGLWWAVTRARRRNRGGASADVGAFKGGSDD